ncbi:MAG: DUF3102 domain-containing protein [Crocosphaera sp.]|nr:DUF3102 domain-containing protein [Crocosphaera sp.]
MSKNTISLAKPNVSQPFDDSQITPDDQIIIQQRTYEIKNLIRRTASNLIDIGQKLHEVKKLLGHGHFGHWLKTEFNWSVATATKMMQASQRFKNVNFTNLNFSASAIYLLAAPSTPTAARQEAITKAQQGQAITYTLAKQIVCHYKYRNQSLILKQQPLSFSASCSLEIKVDLPFFEQYTLREWLRLKREQKFFSLIHCTLDNFPSKAEQSTDTVIDTFSKIVSHSIQSYLHRPTDVFTEYEPGKFLILLSNTSSEGVENIVKVIQKNINLQYQKHLNSHDSHFKLFKVNFKTFSSVPSSKISLNQVFTELTQEHESYRLLSDG